MRYAQITSGRKLHLIFNAEGELSQPICGITTNRYRMTINVPLAHACHNCLRIFDINGGAKIRKRFFERVGGTG